ncbi:MAG: MFS transporter [Candidatus Aenigmatarchaeota archaeon]
MEGDEKRKKKEFVEVKSESFAEIVDGEVIKEPLIKKKSVDEKTKQLCKKEVEEKKKALKKYEKFVREEKPEKPLIVSSSFVVVDGDEIIPPEAKKEVKQEPKTEEEKRKKIESSMRNSTLEGVFNSASGSIQSSFATPFALSLGATNVEIGLMTSIQNFASTISHLPGSMLTKCFTRKGIWVFSHIIARILLWIPILFLPFLPIENRVLIFIVLIASSNFFLMIRSPAWSSLMGDIVPYERRGEYFGKRNMWIGLAGVFATLTAGFLIFYFGFEGIFLLSIVLAIFAVIFFVRMYEPPMKKIFHYKYKISFRPKEWYKAMKINKEFVIFTTYLTFMNFAIDIAAPFYAVYTLKDLNISYEWFAVSIVAGAIVKALTMKHWGILIKRFGNRKILIVTSILTPFVPLGWLLSSNLFHIFIVRIYDGLIFSGFELVIFNYLLEVAPARGRPKYVGIHNFAIGMGLVLGDIFGAMFVGFFSNGFLIFSCLQFVFFISFLLRLTCLVFLLYIKTIDVKQSDIIPVRYVFWQALVVEPGRGIKSTIAYTFRYPRRLEEELKATIKKMKYSLKLKMNI